MNDLKKMRTNIQKTGRWMYRTFSVVKVILILMIIAQSAITVLVVFNKQLSDNIGPYLGNNFLQTIVKEFASIDTLDMRYQAAIGCFVNLITYCSFLHIIKIGIRLMKPLAEGNRPFERDTAKHMRRSAFYLLLFIVYNPLLGIISFNIMLLLSYIMEYGAYIQERADETNRIQEEMIMSFAEITENKSGQTGQHIKRVSEYSRVLAEELGLEPEHVEHIRIASTMHDVGKLLIPSEILEKPGRLTNEEYAVIKTHTTLGGKLLDNVEGEEMKLSRTIALQHHERYDGKGYPRQMAGEEISLEGRIVAVADVYDALTSKRSYKNAWTEEDAYNEIIKGRGTQFDPKVVDAFVSAHDRILEVRDKYRDSEYIAA